ncbi:hypothetical protein J1614_012269 [Plenodomus biglobosus]|nr:hypothetical protein J1614_012269 [Plenodomus biglobosus]
MSISSPKSSTSQTSTRLSRLARHLPRMRLVRILFDKCKKQNLSFVVHLYAFCDVLMRHKEQLRRLPTNLRHHHSSPARSTAHPSAPAVKTPPKKRKRAIDDVSAHAAIRRPNPSSRDNDSNPVWLLDTGASRHITGCADDFVSLIPKQGTITVAGGIKLPMHGIGLIQLRCRLPDGYGGDRPLLVVSRASRSPLEVIHSDLSGKFSRPGLGGAWYYISFICEATHHPWERFLKRKSEAPQAIMDFVAYAMTQFGGAT